MTKHCLVMGEPKGKGRPRFAQGHAYTPQATRDYEKLIQAEYKRQCGDRFPDDSYIKLQIIAHFAVPKSAKKAEKIAMLNDEIMPTKKPDADNILKIVADALNGVAYSDDKQIVEMRVEKRYDDRGHINIRLSDVYEVDEP